MTFDEAVRVYYETFLEMPPLAMMPDGETGVALLEEAIERGRPMTTEDIIEDDPALLADYRAGHVVF